MPAEKKESYTAQINLGPGIQTLVDKQIHDALAVTFNKERVEAMVEAEVLKRVQFAVERTVNDARSGWMTQNMRDYISQSILNRMSKGNWNKRIDTMIEASWKAYTEGENASGQKELKELAKRSITERIWQLARESDGMAMVKEAIEDLVLKSLQSAAEEYAGRVVVQYIEKNAHK